MAFRKASKKEGSFYGLLIELHSLLPETVCVVFRTDCIIIIQGLVTTSLQAITSWWHIELLLAHWINMILHSLSSCFFIEVIYQDMASWLFVHAPYSKGAKVRLPPLERLLSLTVIDSEILLLMLHSYQKRFLPKHSTVQLRLSELAGTMQKRSDNRGFR